MIKSGIRLIRATGYSLAGLRAAFTNEQAFRQEVYALILVVLPLGLIMGKNRVEKILLIASWLIVIITELVNSAIEAAVDRSGLETHELSRRAKDIGSAAVFIALVLAFLTWSLILVR